MSKNEYLITQSLIGAYQYMFVNPDKGYEDFLLALRREKAPPTKAMLNGIKFENLVTEYLASGEISDDNPWKDGVKGVASVVKGSSLQVKLSTSKTIDGIPFVLYGILDGLCAGTIYDIKFSQVYHLNKYLDSPQHPMYFELCPEATKFTYVISDGSFVWTETYLREDTESIDNKIRAFVSYLDRHGLDKIYAEKWKSQY